MRGMNLTRNAVAAKNFALAFSQLLFERFLFDHVIPRDRQAL